jgi:hypothetical protein
MKSLRPLIAIGGAAAKALGIAQATGTMAVSTDAVNSTGAQVATGNFCPTPLTAGPVNCWYDAPWYDTVTGRRVSISWPPVPGATGYKVVFVRKSDPNFVVRVNDLGANQTSISGITHGSQNVMYARIHTVNGPVVSSGYKTSVEITHKDLVSNRTECQGGTGPELANQAWENTRDWDPTTPDPNGSAARGVAPEAMEMQQDVIEETKAGQTTTPEPTSTTEAPDSTTTETPTSATTTPVATTSPETTPTEDPKPVLTNTLESGGLTAGWTVGGNKVAVVDADGNELASGRAKSGSALHWLDGQLWIVGDTEVYRIMESPQDGKWKFYKDSGQNMPDFG